MEKELKDFIDQIKPVDPGRLGAYRKYWDTLIHPRGSLGELEEISIKVCAILGRIPQDLKKVTLVMCADNGVLEEGVSASPVEITQQLAVEMTRGGNGLNALSETAGSAIEIYDLGLKDFSGHAGIHDRRIANGTRNLMEEPAMTRQETLAAIQVGIEAVQEAVQAGYEVIGTGELGMGNTTTSALVIKALTGSATSEVLGLGAGINPDQVANKERVLDQALDLWPIQGEDPLSILHHVGGLDIAALTGVYLGAAHSQVPVFIDGIISAAAALTAYKIKPETKDYMLASHIPYEKGGRLALQALDLPAYLDLKLRLGEGTGCPLAFQLMDAGLACMQQMASFDSAQIEDASYNIRD